MSPHFFHWDGGLFWRSEAHKDAHEHTRATFEGLLAEMAWSDRFTAEIKTALHELDAYEAQHTEEKAA